MKLNTQNSVLALTSHLPHWQCHLLQALCYGTRHIVDTMVEAGHEVDSVTVCGGLAKSTLFLQTQVYVLLIWCMYVVCIITNHYNQTEYVCPLQADVLGREVLVPQETESVLLGAAMLAMSAAR